MRISPPAAVTSPDRNGFIFLVDALGELERRRTVVTDSGTGLVDRTGGPDWWTGLGGPDWWTRLGGMDWGGPDWWLHTVGADWWERTGGTGSGGSDWYLVQLDPLLVPLGAGVGDPQGTELGPEQVGGVLLHGGHVEAEHLGGDALGAQVV